MKKKPMETISSIFSNPFTYAVFIIVAALVAAFNAKKASKKTDGIVTTTQSIEGTTNATFTRLENVSTNLITTLGKIEQANSKLEENRSSINDTYEKTIESLKATLQSKDEILGMITGGDSYPQLTLTKNAFFVVVNGTYGIPNLKVEVYHLKDYNSIPSEVVSDYLLNNTISGYIQRIYSSEARNLGVGNVNPIEYDSFIRTELANTNISHGFDIFYTGDYKSWVQKIRLIPVNGKWEFLDCLEESSSFNKTTNLMNTRKTIYFKTSENFPYLSKIDDKVYCGSSSCYVFDHKVHPIPIPNLLHEIKKENFIPTFGFGYFE